MARRYAVGFRIGKCWPTMPAQTDRHVNLTPVFYDRELDFESPTTRQALQYWNACAGERTMPAFADLSLRGMKTFVANASLIEMVSSGDGAVDYSIRLTGERVRERYGSVAHRTLSEFLPPHMEQRWRDSLEMVRVAKAPLRVHGRMTYESHAWLYQETFLAPLRGADGAVGLFLTVTAWWSIHDDGKLTS